MFVQIVTLIFMTVLFTVAPNWRQPEFLLEADG
jgi:hypothetical protein